MKYGMPHAKKDAQVYESQQILIKSFQAGKLRKREESTMKMSNAEYSQYVDRLAPKSKLWKNMFNAFWTGGLICTFGQLLMNWFQSMELGDTMSGTATSICLIFLAALLTGLAVFDDIAKVAGAGTLVPITGFANSIVAPAIEFRTEGVVLGTCAKMFTIAGPVLVFGTVTSTIYGFILWICTRF